MATLDYCAFENTADDMAVALEKLERLNTLADLDEHERKGFNSLVRMCARFTSVAATFDA